MQTPQSLMKVVLAAKIEGIAMVFAAWWSGDYLNINYPKDFSWFLVTFAVAFLLISHTFYRVVRTYLRIYGGRKNSR